MLLKSVTVYQKPEGLLLQANALSTQGMLVVDLNTPVQQLLPSVEVAELGNALMQLVLRARVDVPHPTDWKQLKQQWLAHLGMRSERALYKECKVCSVSHSDGHFHLWATRTDSVGALNIGQPLVVSENDSVAIGQGILHMLEQSQR
jgi:hypothetical protein